MELLPADLILVRGTSLLDRAIEDVEHSPYSHMAGVYRDTTLIEAQGFRKIGFQSLYKYEGCSDVYRLDYLSHLQRQAIVSNVLSQVGGRYDYPLILWEFIRYKLHVNLPYREPFHSRLCSTLWINGGYRKSGVPVLPGIRFPSPGDTPKGFRKIGSI